MTFAGSAGKDTDAVYFSLFYGNMMNFSRAEMLKKGGANIIKQSAISNQQRPNNTIQSPYCQGFIKKSQ